VKTRSSLIARAGVAPIYREASLRSEQVSQCVLGETAHVLDTQGSWRRVRHDGDRYEGWMHLGYTLEVDAEIAQGWRASATGWSDGAVVRSEDGEIIRLPLRARVGLAGPRIDLPDGRQGVIVAGSVTPYDRVMSRADAISPDLWAWQAFGGTPYQWGGVTPWGVDCSGLVQTTFLARGTVLPRDASQQVQSGAIVPLDEHRQGDLLFFAENGDRITHVAFAGPNDTLVHSTVACGGLVMEPWGPGTRAMILRTQLIAVRRVE
jgi:gamma-D-glutamyl-L-lysine dipeptidyl-peptidase